MIRPLTASLLALAFVSSSAYAQDGPLQRAGRALDNAGRNIRNRVEAEIARDNVPVAVQERDVLDRVLQRIAWDKKLQGSALRLESRVDGVIILRGSVVNEEAKKWVVDLAANTIGVLKVIDETAVADEVKIIESQPVPPAPTTPVQPPPS